MKRLLIFIFSGLAILTVAIMLKSCNSGKELKVSVEQPAMREITEIVTANGKIQPEIELKLSSDVSGEIIEMKVKEGDRVKKGDLLCRIKPDIYESSMEKMSAAVNSSKAGMQNAFAMVEQAKATLKNLESVYNRNKRLYDQKAISQQEYEASLTQFETAKANVKAAEESAKGSEFNIRSAEASLREANTNLTKTYIYAPVDGTVSKLNKERGERVVGTATMEGTEILRLANLNEMEVSVDVNENDIVRVHLKDLALIEVDAYGDRKFKGIVTEIANSANNNSGLSAEQVTNFTVKIRIIQDSYKDLITPENPAPFRPGMSAAVEIQTKTVKNALSIPILAVTTRLDSSKIKTESTKEKNGMEVTNLNLEKQEQKQEIKADEVVFIVKENEVKMVKVKTGIQDNNYIQIIEGINSKDQVISAPYSAVSRELRDKSKVVVVPKEELFTKTADKQ
jgi:HlyD family secretion protein